MLVAAAFVFPVHNVLEEGFVGVAVVQLGRHGHTQILRGVPGAVWILEGDAGRAGGRCRRVAMVQRYRANFGVSKHDQLARLAGQVHHQQILDRLS